VVESQPRQLVLGALIVLGALHALTELFSFWDRLRMETTTRTELDDLPLTTDERED
jgi:hypothetical protein